MTPSTKKLILVLVSPFFLFAYIALVLTVSDFVPGNKFVQLVFYVLAGVIWAFPLKPVFQWANRPVDE